jgi:hypothetical protein
LLLPWSRLFSAELETREQASTTSTSWVAACDRTEQVCWPDGPFVQSSTRRSVLGHPGLAHFRRILKSYVGAESTLHDDRLRDFGTFR